MAREGFNEPPENWTTLATRGRPRQCPPQPSTAGGLFSHLRSASHRTAAACAIRQPDSASNASTQLKSRPRCRRRTAKIVVVASAARPAMLQFHDGSLIKVRAGASRDAQGSGRERTAAKRRTDIPEDLICHGGALLCAAVVFINAKRRAGEALSA
jgi:hypothetical protein